jgi:PAS domain S-box-containing protein
MKISTAQNPGTGVAGKVCDRAQCLPAQLEEAPDTSLAATLQWLQEVSTCLIEGADTEALYRRILEVAIHLMRSDMGTLQMFDDTRGELHLIASRGLDPALAKSFGWVGIDANTTCGEALRQQCRIVVPDIEACDAIARTPAGAAHLAAGVRAAQSTPLISRSGRLLGMISNHWRKPHHPSEQDLSLLDVLARQAADLIERATAEVKLRESEARARQVLDSITDSVQVIASDWRLTDMNAASRRTLIAQGLQPDRLIGQHFWNDIFPAARGTQAERECTRAMTERVAVEFENFYAPWQRWYAIRIYPVESGGIAIHSQDITERKDVEATTARDVRVKDALFRLADRLQHVQSLDDVYDAALQAITSALQCDRASILLFDSAGVMRFVAWTGLTDTYRVAVEGHSPWAPGERNPDPIGIDDIETADLDDALRATIKAEGIAAAAFIPLVANGILIGKFMTYFNTPHAFIEDEFAISLAIARQLAAGIERQRASQALRASEQRFQMAARATNDAIRDWNLVTSTVWWNEAVMTMFGYRPTNVGRDVQWWYERIHPDDRERVTAGIRSASDGDESFWRDEYRFRRADDTYASVFDRGYIIRSGAGKAVRMIGAMQDVTERKCAEDKLKEADRRKNEFLAMLAHELRNPLAPIANAAHLLRQDNASDAIQQHARDIIDRQVERLIRLVDDLLEVSRITSGRIRLHKQWIAIGDAVERAVESVRPLIEQNRHTLSLSLPPNPVWLYGDTTRLEQVIVNLISNAAKYTDTGGRIGIAVHAEGEQVVLRVSDNGMGIDAELLPHIFDLFTQADRSLDRSQGGLGIGLSLVQQLVLLHGGTVTVESTPGRGSEFIVRLPAAPTPKLEPRISASPACSASPGPLRVLVVDDNVDAAQSLAKLLEMSGHIVWVAYDGPAALAAADEHRPTVMFLDIGLPGFDGYEVAKRVRQHATLGHMVLIAMTGYGQANDRERSREAGFNHYLVKPVAFSTVEKILVEIALNHHPTESPAREASLDCDGSHERHSGESLVARPPL